jgi:hypothetical protein
MRQHKRTQLTGLLAALLLALILPLAPASAQTETAGELAAYYPADTMLYVDLRIDDDYVAELDAIVGRLVAQIEATPLAPALFGMPVTVSAAIEELALFATGRDYGEEIRPWLGDRVAFGLLGGLAAGEPENVLVSAPITDEDAAREFIQSQMVGDTGWTRSREGEFIVYEHPDTFANPIIGLGADMVFLATDRALLPLDGPPASSLAASERFQETVALLPAQAYNILLYGDIAALMRDSMGPGALSGAELELLAAAGYAAIGGAILDGRALTIDIAQAADEAILSDLTPVNPAFLAHVPADAAFVLHGTDVRGLYDSTLDNLRGLVGEEAFDQQLVQFEQLFSILTGLDMQADVLSWLGGDFALFLSYDVPEPGAPSTFSAPLFPDEDIPLSFGFGLVIEAVDPASAARVVAGLEGLLTQFLTGAPGVAVERQTLAGAEAVVLVIDADPPELIVPLEIAIAANDEVFVVATLDAAFAALEGSGGLDTDAHFSEAGRYLLDGATSVWYAGPGAFNLLGDLVLAFVPATSEVVVSAVAVEVPVRPVTPADDATLTPEEIERIEEEQRRLEEELQRREEEREQRQREFRQQQRETLEEVQGYVREFAALFHSATISSAEVEGGMLLRLVLALSE